MVVTQTAAWALGRDCANSKSMSSRPIREYTQKSNKQTRRDTKQLSPLITAITKMISVLFVYIYICVCVTFDGLETHNYVLYLISGGLTQHLAFLFVVKYMVEDTGRSGSQTC